MSRLSRRVVLRGSLAGAGTLAGLRVARAQQSGPVKIGFASCLSGPLAIIGNDILMGAQLATDYINKNGGAAGRQVELVVKDTKTNPNESVAVVRELLSDGVKLIVGGLYGPEAAGQTPIVAEANGILVIQGTQAMSVTHEQYVRNMFRTSEDSVETMMGFVRLAVDKYPDVTDWVFFAIDSASDRQAWDVFNKLMTQEFGKIGKKVNFIDPIWVKVGATDFHNELAAIMSSPVQGIYSLVYGSAGITAYTQAHALGLQNKVKVIFDSGNEIGFAKAMKQNVPPNMWVTTPWYHALYPGNAVSDSIYQAYVAKTGDHIPQGWLQFGAAPVFALAKGVETAGGSTETDRVIAALESGVTFNTLKGPGRFRKDDHQMVADLNYIEYAPTSEDPGFKIAEMIKYDGAQYLEPPAPGKTYVP
jgi:branched-chain amino acid transport system substrate-binding protein